MAKMGRPPKAKSEVKSTTLTLRITRSERKLAVAAAKQARVPLSEWARQAVTAASKLLP